MASVEWIRATVAYATPQLQITIPLQVPAGSTLEQAIRNSGILEQCAGIDLATNPVGIFGERANLDDLVPAGGRIEIYRALIADPKMARRRRAVAKLAKTR